MNHYTVEFAESFQSVITSLTCWLHEINSLRSTSTITLYFNFSLKHMSKNKQHAMVIAEDNVSKS